MPRSTLFAVKPIAQLLAEGSDEGEHTLKRALGRWSLVAIGIGAIIGAGIFVMTGIGAHGSTNADGTVKILGAGPALVLSFVLAGIACVFAGLCYAEFASMIPLAGSAYTYAYATLGELFAWIIGWDLVLEYMMGAATVSVGWSGYLVKFLKLFGVHLPEWLTNDWITYSRAAAEAAAGGHVWPAPPEVFGIPIVFNLLALLVALLVTAVLAVGIQESARFNAGIVAVKTSVVVMVILIGAFFVKPTNWGASWSDFAPNGMAGIASGAAYIFFAYIGFDAISTTAQEARNPQKDMPFGIIGSLLVCTVLYIAVAAVLTGMMKWNLIDLKAPLAHAFESYGLGWAVFIITGGALAGLTSVMLVMLLGQTRVFFAMSRDGLLPRRIFSEVHRRYRTPFKMTWIIGSVCALLGAFTPIDDLGQMVNIGTLLAFVIVCLAVVILRRTNPETHRPFRTPFVPLVPILGAVSCLYLMANLGLPTWIRLFVWLCIGLVVFFGYSRRHSKLTAKA
ncbi:MAG TPA: amino acid permease [Thermoanaerobaculia bacterium]|nr:amino acid permease [Thermoanaerobaculia bacterium]